MQAFEDEAVDYILKPVVPERLKKTISRLNRAFAKPQPSNEIDDKVKKWKKEAKALMHAAKKKVEKNNIEFEGIVIGGHTSGIDLTTFANNPKNKIDQIVIGFAGHARPVHQEHRRIVIDIDHFANSHAKIQPGFRFDSQQWRSNERVDCRVVVAFPADVVSGCLREDTVIQGVVNNRRNIELFQQSG